MMIFREIKFKFSPYLKNAYVLTISQIPIIKKEIVSYPEPYPYPVYGGGYGGKFKSK